METRFLTPGIGRSVRAAGTNEAPNPKSGTERVAADVDAETVVVAFDPTKTYREAIAEAPTDSVLASRRAKRYGSTGGPTPMKMRHLLRHCPNLSTARLSDLAGGGL